jgi:DNA repair protein RecO (recombination protein O)
MLQWGDTGIVISVARHGEQSAILRLLTAQHGLQPGMAKGVYSKKHRGTFQPGNVVHAHWQARLEEHLGFYSCELQTSVTAQLLSQPMALRLVNAMAAMVLACVPERIDEYDIFNKCSKLIGCINLSDDIYNWLCAYVEFEFTTLHALGFGLDLSACAATGATDPQQLTHVSPKSGRAVCAAAAEPYRARLLPLPPFLRDGKSTSDPRQMLDGLALTGYFLEAWVLNPEGRKIPEARKELLAQLRREKFDNLD